MAAARRWDERFDRLNQLALVYEVSVTPFFEADYLAEFYDFYRVKDRHPRLIPAEGDFRQSLKDLCGERGWEAIAAETEGLFGPPKRVMVFDDAEKLRQSLGGPRGCVGWFFVFDLMFCEFGDFTLCYICGTNN